MTPTIAANAGPSASLEVKCGKKLTIGILALQGDFEAHARAFANAGAYSVPVRKPTDLTGLDGFVMPGGESTTMLKFLERDCFIEMLKELLSTTPCFATCAGCILLAREVLSPTQPSLGLLDVTVERNAYGRQIDSAVIIEETELSGGPLEMVFIRAPRITRTGAGVEVLARRDGSPTLVRQGHLLAATFHPEMTADVRVQNLFLDLVCAHKLIRERSLLEGTKHASEKKRVHEKQRASHTLAQSTRKLLSVN